MSGSSPFPAGTKVMVKDFPLPVGQAVPFDFNGLVGVVKSSEKVGFGFNNQPVYNYLVSFENVEVPYSKMNPTSRKIERGIQTTNAEQFFEEIFLTRVV
jgi:hypothetical protein